MVIDCFSFKMETGRIDCFNYLEFFSGLSTNLTVFTFAPSSLCTIFYLFSLLYNVSHFFLIVLLSTSASSFNVLKSANFNKPGLFLLFLKPDSETFISLSLSLSIFAQRSSYTCVALAYIIGIISIVWIYMESVFLGVKGRVTIFPNEDMRLGVSPRMEPALSRCCLYPALFSANAVCIVYISPILFLLLFVFILFFIIKFINPSKLKKYQHRVQKQIEKINLKSYYYFIYML